MGKRGVERLDGDDYTIEVHSRLDFGVEGTNSGSTTDGMADDQMIS